MERKIEYRESAFKHGFTDADIRWAFETSRYDYLIEDTENKYLLLGFDSQGNPIEVMYNEIDDTHIRVFHAMTCRNEWLPLYNFGGNNARH